ncbi:EAL domain-containing protein [Roseibium sp.]|uniref:sensor domain-containing phosphodiesterase n=1 Tax=Roseibium sp. TaxID=1936156 RepID=UPI003A984EDB
MSKFPVPDNEMERLAELRSLNIIDTKREPAFDAVTKLAAAIFECPIALISLVEENYQWFKSSVGLDAECTSRNVSFCTHAVASGDVLVVEDALYDQRFCDNPLVNRAPWIRFYAGCPISLDGERFLGALCVIDRKPRMPTQSQLEQLKSLANIVEGLMRSYQAVSVAHESSWLAQERSVEVARKNRLLKQVETLAEIGAFRVNLATRETVWSDQIFALHGLPVSDKSPSLDEALEYFPEDERLRVLQTVERDLASKGSFLVDADFMTAKGDRRRIRFMGEVDTGSDNDSVVIGVMDDITERYEQEQGLWRTANIDALSGLGNRHWFHNELDRVLKQVKEEGSYYALMLIDLDGFKLANDSLGHQAGDEVIRVVSRRIRDVAGEDAICARIGGDEFAIIVCCNKVMLPRQLGSMIISRIKEAIPFEKTAAYVSASIGIAFAPMDAKTPEDLMKFADMALYRVKRSGRGRVGVYTQELKRIFGARQKAIDVVRSAYRSDRIRAHYQPIVDLTNRQLRGAEALVRISSPNNTLLGPDDFWEAFKDPESARIVDSSVFQLVLDDLAKWKAEKVDPGCVSINASKYWFQTEDFATGFLTLLDEHKISPGVIRLEVTESVLLNEETESVSRILLELREAGVSIALDDFGAGFASLTHLRDYPIDSIKIDRSFIKGLESSQQSTLIVRSIVELSRNFDLTVIAAGVETVGQAEYLRAIGCDQAQGSLFGSAVEAAKLHDSLVKSAASDELISFVI